MNVNFAIGQKDNGKQWLTTIISTIALAKDDRLLVLQNQAAEAAQIVHYGLMAKHAVVAKISGIAETAGYVEEFGRDAVQKALGPFGDDAPSQPAAVRRVMFQRTGTNVIMATKFPPLRAIVPGYLYEGFTALAGRQKLGKTWLAIDWAVAVAIGGVAMGSIDCAAGNVLYIDMENGPRRIQGRIKTLFPDEKNVPDLSRLEWVTEAPQLDQGLIPELERWRTSVSVPTMVVIDVLQRIKPAGSMARNAYENDYSAWAPLQQWATENNVAVLGLHHTKKGGADDPLEALSGSNGLSACADTTIVLDQDQNGRTLYVRGRDVEEKEAAVQFTGGLWTVLGDAAAVRRSDERKAILGALAKASPLGPKDIAAATGMKDGNVRFLLGQMVAAGEIQKKGYGLYTPPNTANTPHTWTETEDEDC
ncbi:AAA family ATPase [Bradyrhizobium sp. JYMT SZCCT0428]|uniref:AAA family ATPase n=1 Tax=Bradyrhizobium sp. JYMT SZCCT0428 TaxID=2807673 RepID=UPI001BA8A0EF|nr:AAA family ATPase [Bradyrhizobium sp. JYMT SZCCT0428]MBR1153147.1 AAA family ATPase [Bradyrhizobium sp. JYMT SZCCT0428]